MEAVSTALLAQRRKTLSCPGAAHVLDVIAAISVHCIGKAFLDEVGNTRQVANDVERTHLWDLSSDGGCDGSHAGIIQPLPMQERGINWKLAISLRKSLVEFVLAWPRK